MGNDLVIHYEICQMGVGPQLVIIIKKPTRLDNIRGIIKITTLENIYIRSDLYRCESTGL